MNYIKAQKDVFNEICKGSRVAKFMLDENHVLVSPNGCMAYIFPVSTIAFNLEKVKDINPLEILEVVNPENELQITPDLRLIDNFHPKYMARRLKGNKKSVFLNVKFLECFQNPKFYQEKNNKSGIVVVTEKITSKIEEPVGIVLPLRATWDDGHYYCEDEKEVI